MPTDVRATSFAELYVAHARPVYRFALYLCGDREIAADITSETFLRVWTADQPLRVESVRTWLFVIARNVYLHELRHLRRRAALDSTMPSADSVSTSVEAKETLQQTLKALAGLPEVDRSALLLRVVQELPYARIAAILHISIAAAKVKVHRARVRLHLLAEGQEGDRHEPIERSHS